jgi:hypothetical protein
MEGAAMNITVVSYAGSVDFGVIACARSVPRAAEIALGFSAAVADLSKLAAEFLRRASRRRRTAPLRGPRATTRTTRTP